MYVVLCKCIFGTFCCCTLKLEPTTKYKIFADTLLPESCFQYQVKQLSTLSLQHSEISQAGPEITTGTSYQTTKPVTQLAFSARQSQPSSTNNVSVILFTSDNTGSHSGQMAHHRCIKLSALTKPKRNFIRNYD